MATFRGFIAIDTDVSSKIIQFQNEINKTGASLKLVEPKNIHITLKFLGDTEETLIDEIEKIMENAVKDIDPFNIQLKGTGVFPNNDYIKVVWIGMSKVEQIADIARKIDEPLSKLGFEKERREFSSHLTIARVKNAKNKEKLVRTIENYNEVEFADIKVNSITLKKSELTPKGPIYTTLKKITLG